MSRSIQSTEYTPNHGKGESLYPVVLLVNHLNLEPQTPWSGLDHRLSPDYQSPVAALLEKRCATGEDLQTRVLNVPINVDHSN